jgi:hypothetical protein
MIGSMRLLAVGTSYRAIFPATSQQGKEFPPAGNRAGKEGYGNDGSGNIFYAIRMILTGMLIIFIGIPLRKFLHGHRPFCKH